MIDVLNIELSVFGQKAHRHRDIWFDIHVGIDFIFKARPLTSVFLVGIDQSNRCIDVLKMISLE